MKSSKDALRTARQLMQVTMNNGTVDAERARSIVRKIMELKPRGYVQTLNAYNRLLRLELEKRHAVVESAVELSGEMQNTVSADLRNKYGSDLTFEFKVNPELLGGMRVRVGSDVWDGTVKARLQRLQEAFG